MEKGALTLDKKISPRLGSSRELSRPRRGVESSDDLTLVLVGELDGGKVRDVCNSRPLYVTGLGEGHGIYLVTAAGSRVFCCPGE